MENPNTNTRPATPAEPAADGIREAQQALAAYETGSLPDTMEAAADAFEARLAETEKEVEALPLSELVHHLEAAAYQITEHAHDCRGDDDCEWSYRFEACAVYRAARTIKALADLGVAGPELVADKPDPLLVKLSQVEAALDGFTQEDCEWTSASTQDFVDQLRSILKGGAR